MLAPWFDLKGLRKGMQAGQHTKREYEATPKLPAFMVSWMVAMTIPNAAHDAAALPVRIFCLKSKIHSMKLRCRCRRASAEITILMFKHQAFVFYGVTGP